MQCLGVRVQGPGLLAGRTCRRATPTALQGVPVTPVTPQHLCKVTPGAKLNTSSCLRNCKDLRIFKFVPGNDVETFERCPAVEALEPVWRQNPRVPTVPQHQRWFSVIEPLGSPHGFYGVTCLRFLSRNARASSLFSRSADATCLSCSWLRGLGFWGFSV